MIPKECVNNNCKNIMYVPAYKLHMLLQCEKCIEMKTSITNSISNDVVHSKKRIATGLRLIDTWTQNIQFFKERIKLQEEGKVIRGVRKYYQHDIDAEQKKIDDAKDNLRRLGHKF